MSAYGAITNRRAGESPVPSTIWPSRPSKADNTSPTYLTLHHLTLAHAAALPGLVEYLHNVFAHFIEEGATYPQETAPGEMYERTAFESYFFAGDVIVGLTGSGSEQETSKVPQGALDGLKEATELDIDIEVTRAGRTWEDCIAGFYYVRYTTIFL